MTALLQSAKTIYHLLPQQFRSKATRKIAALLAPRPLNQTPRPILKENFPRIIIGQLSSPYSFGRLARSTGAAFKQQDYFDTYGIDLSKYMPQGTDGTTVEHELLPPPTSLSAKSLKHCIYFLNGNLLPFGQLWTPRSIISNAFISAIWAWEVETVPKSWKAGIDRVDEVIAPSNFVKAAISATFPNKPIRVVSPSLSGLIPPPADHHSMQHDPLVVLSSSNLGSDPERKNPLATLLAFCDAFTNNSGPTLKMHLNSPEEAPVYVSKLKAIAAKRNDVILTFGTLCESSYREWWRGGHIFCSLHRSEGYGMGLAEAMCSGYAAIGTAYSSVLDFMTEQNSQLINYKRVDIKNRRFTEELEIKCTWAEPSHDHVVQSLRKLNENRIDLITKAKKGKETTQHLVDNKLFVQKFLKAVI